MTGQSPVCKFPYILPSQAQKHVTHNAAVRMLDALVQARAVAAGAEAPPSEPADGDAYLLSGAPEGEWQDHGNELATFQDGGWAYFAAAPGWLVYVVAEDALYRYDGSAWHDVFNGVQRHLGVNAIADDTNRLALSSPASLFDNEGAGHQIKVNKKDAGDTASLLFQTGYDGRAEMGTAGDDDFHIKVSADGTSWTEALAISGTTGETAFGAAISTPGDIHARRFLATCADFTYLVTTIDNTNPSAVSSVFEFSFAGIRRYAFGASEGAECFEVTAYDSQGNWAGSPLVIEYAGAGLMSNALYIKSDSSVGIGKVPTAKLDVDGAMKLRSLAKASLPDAATTGAGAVAFVSDASGGAQLAYCDGSAWLAVRDGSAI